VTIRTASPTTVGPQRSRGTVLTTSYFGGISTDRKPAQRGGQAFLNEFVPGHVIKPHFHVVDQFQIVVKGSATLGKHLLRPVAIHYTDAYTPYGPIVVQDEGMAFFNFRSRVDPGAQFMPEFRDRMPRTAGRTLYGDIRLQLGAETGCATRMDAIVEQQDDGLGVYEILAAPNARLKDDLIQGGLRFDLVIDGTLQCEGSSLPRDSVVLGDPGDVLRGRRAGPEGLHLLQCQLPAGD
jgi:hypothetical protein